MKRYPVLCDACGREHEWCPACAGTPDIVRDGGMVRILNPTHTCSPASILVDGKLVDPRTGEPIRLDTLHLKRLASVTMNGSGPAILRVLARLEAIEAAMKRAGLAMRNEVDRG